MIPRSLLVPLLAVFPLLALCPTLGAAAEKPNIIFILADDLGYGDLGCYNKNSKIPTPHLDHLASGGMRFTDAHAPTSVCTPTRYAILTGRYCWRSRLKRGVLGPWGSPLIEEGRLTVPEMLRQNGYSTACIGKWHLGLGWPTKDGAPPSSAQNRLSNVDFTKPIAHGPITRGFDYYFGVDLPNYPPYCFVENDHTVGIPGIPDAGREELFNRPGPMLPGWKLVNILPELTRRAVKFVEDSAKSSKPFFLFFTLTSPHYPVVPAPEFKGKSGAGDYGDFVHQTDWTVGQVLDAVTRSGIEKNTLVFFTSDNGPEVIEIKPGAYERIPQYHHYSMGNLRGTKRDAWEGGHRVPFMARWPGKVPENSVSHERIAHVDLMRTLATLMDISLPDHSAVDSYDILPALTGRKTGAPIREAVVHHSADGHFAIRRGDYVFIDWPTGDDNREPATFKQERGYEPHDFPGELYDLRQDLSEKRNLFGEKPEIVREMKALLQKYKREGRSTPGAPQPSDVPLEVPVPRKVKPSA